MKNSLPVSAKPLLVNPEALSMKNVGVEVECLHPQAFVRCEKISVLHQNRFVFRLPIFRPNHSWPGNC